MKRIYLLFILQILTFLSCKKSSLTNPPVASLSLINVVVGGSAVKLGSNATLIFNNSYWPLALQENNDGLYIWPVGDSSHPYYNQSKFEIEDRAFYSLFLSGTPAAIDGFLVKESIPYHTDSVCGIRFVNLSPNSNSNSGFNITFPNSTTVYEVANLQYKQMTDFKIYPGKASTANYIFQIRKASDNTLLFTYTLATTPRFANVTLVIRGLVNGNPSIAVTRVSNDR
jgi:hypothetical protein